MKKPVLLGLMIIFMAVFTACSGSKPDSVVKEFSEAVKSFDTAKMQECLGSDEELSEIENDDMSDTLLEFFKGEASKIEYEILETTVDGDKGTVLVSYKYTDCSQAFGEALSDYFVKAFGMALTGATEEEMYEVLFDSFSEKLQNGEHSETSAEVAFNCTKASGKWIIDEMPEQMQNVLTCNMIASMDALSNAFGGDESSTETKPEADTPEEVIEETEPEDTDTKQENGPSESATDSEKAIVQYAENEVDPYGLVHGVADLSNLSGANSVEVIDSALTLFQGYDQKYASGFICIKNTSDHILSLNGIGINYENADGKLLGFDEFANSIPQALNPGEIGYIYSYYYDASNFDTTTGIRLVPQGGIAEANNYFKADISDISFKTSGNWVEVTARATNNTSSDISFGYPSAVFYDKDNSVIGFCYGIESVEKGQTKSFNISGDPISYDIDLSAVDHVEVYLQGSGLF